MCFTIFSERRKAIGSCLDENCGRCFDVLNLITQMMKQKAHSEQRRHLELQYIVQNEVETVVFFLRSTVCHGSPPEVCVYNICRR